MYALAEAALVVNSDYEKGGTWTGAVEQLEKLRFVTVYVRSTGEIGKGLRALERKGALPWPNPDTQDGFAQALSGSDDGMEVGTGQSKLPLQIHDPSVEPYVVADTPPPVETGATATTSEAASTPGEELFAKVRELLEKITVPKSQVEIASDLEISNSQAKVWLQRLVEEGTLERLERPVRYRKAPHAQQGTLVPTPDAKEPRV